MNIPLFVQDLSRSACPFVQVAKKQEKGTLIMFPEGKK